MKYKNLTAPSTTILDEKVQELLDAGWEICGSPYATGNAVNQCMVSEPPERQQQGLTVDDIATLSLLQGGFRRGPRRW